MNIRGGKLVIKEHEESLNIPSLKLKSNIFKILKLLIILPIAHQKCLVTV